ncbi:MAG TPA: c-type cytochrome, partial [Segetibacter sp.]
MKLKSQLIILVFFIIACNRKRTDVFQQTLNTSNLPEQTFTINTTNDTLLLTLGGAKISIAANSIKSAGNTVTLVLKEALNMQQILLGGLITESKGKMLSSGGMIYIGTKEKSTIVKPFKVSVPATSADTAMKLFIGDVSADSSIDWDNPQPLSSIDTSFYLLGKNIFRNNCRSCHALDRELTGPALRGITKRVSKNWLYAFTKDNQAVLRTGDKHANDIYS